jgi:DMSO/TMAO reductase YedYZ molybdopterin-dependent catalytic subunit
MKKSNKQKMIIFVTVLVIALVLLIYVYLNKPFNQVSRLDSVEIREYQGERLSSVHDFRENSIKGVQYINISDYELEISGLVESPRTYKYEDVLKKDSYEKVITLDCVEGWSAKILWEGVLVRDLLDEVEPTEDAKTLIFYAYDGYSTAFPIEYFYDNDIIIAYKMNNATIIPERGFPFQLVAESKWGYKWIKWITKIELSNNTEYRGYWEQRGYAKEGNLDENFLD